MKTFKIVTIAMVATVLLAVGCNRKSKSEKEVFRVDEQLTQIDSLKKQISREKSIDKTTAERLIFAYRQFVDSFPSHFRTPELMMELSDVYYGQRQFKNQAQTLRHIIENHPDYKKIDVCYYMLAHILDSEFDERVEAKKFYSGLLEKYPRSVFAADAEARMKTIDSLSFNQLIEAITKQNTEPNP